MSEAKKETRAIKWVDVRLVERFSNVLIPIEIPVLLRLLPSIGYIVPAKRLKGVIDPGDSIAVKGNVELLINQDNRSLGVAAGNISELIEGFNELRSFWTEQINPQPAAETHFIELGGQGFKGTDTKPSESFNRFWSEFNRMKDLKKAIGFDVANFGLQLVQKDLEPNGPEWFDITIHPQVTSSANQYYIRTVWRTSNLESGLKNFSQLDSIVDRLIKEIEKK
jgi:hypothetical protein